VSFARRSWLLAAAALAVGCATRPPPSAPAISGRLVLLVEATDAAPKRQFSAAFELRGDGERGELVLTSPLGTIVAVATWAPASAMLKTAEREAAYTDLDALARDALGEALPLRAMPDWLAGRPWAAVPSHPAASGFEQLGWRVQLARYDEGMLRIERADPPAVQLRVRLER
jgi:outer membrane lipoprotein LolB